MVQPVRRTKIVATLGPSWADPAGMRQLLDAGVNVVRVNASHGTPEQREAWIAALRQVIAERGPDRAAALLLDLPGPRIRVGRLPAPLMLETGQRVIFAPEDEASGDEIPVTHAGLAQDVRPGGRILLDDGLLTVDVTATRGSRVEGRVRYGGQLKANKGINLPGIEVSVPAVTDRDREELARVGSLVDFVGISFVRRPEDVDDVRRLVPRSVQLVAKIEKDTALNQLDRI
ncbi:MAG: pyruvate kinase, partial [Gemmatimonadota bacterium]